MCHLQHSASFATIHHPIKYKTRHLSYSISVTSINVSSTDKRHFTDPASLATIKPTAAMIPSVRNVFFSALAPDPDIVRFPIQTQNMGLLYTGNVSYLQVKSLYDKQNSRRCR